MKFYTYAKCSTCKKAEKYMQARGVDFEAIAIAEQPPAKAELMQMLQHYQGQVRKLFNTSGQLYRSMGLSSKLNKMSAEEAIELLSKEGMLVKRPFVLGDGFGVVGFRQESWDALFSES